MSASCIKTQHRPSMSSYSSPQVSGTTLNDFYNASASGRMASRTSDAPPAQRPERYGSDPGDRIEFLQAKLQANIMALHTLRTYYEDTSQDPFSAPFSGSSGKPTIASLSKRVDALDRTLQSLFKTCISATENSTETIVMLLDHLRQPQGRAELTVVTGGGSSTRVASPAETKHAKVSDTGSDLVYPQLTVKSILYIIYLLALSGKPIVHRRSIQNGWSPPRTMS
jgi:hypothetical protein